MTIRTAAGQDIPGLLELLRQVGQVHHEIRPDIFPPECLKYDHEELLVLLEDRKKPVFVAMDGELVAGYCFCQLRDHESGRCSVPRRELYIDDLCVHENCRGTGIATALYRHTEAFARQEGCHSVTLNVWCGNDSAMRFYEKMGLRPRNIMMETVL
ncbi:MAG: GNAT family N-acetyltransferase [Oscillospiraceae bacterium]|nr:GNAT family N-acetyltransferase [Oscillospiraceae bacterium]